jgi:predicted ATP-grasp superfamily ATP-dependent carboligase
MAHDAGIPAPKLVVPSGFPSAAAAVAAVGLPCVLKPRRSVPQMPAEFPGKAFRVDTPEEFTRVFEGLAAHGIEVIASEVVQGADDQLVQYWSYRLPDGELLLELTKHKLRQQPPSFGTGCCQVIAWDEEIAAAGRRFVSAIGLIGYSSVEFKRRPSDGSYALIECNYRLIDANEAGRVAGVDAARVVYRRAAGLPVSPQPRPRDGVCFWHPVRDLRTLRAYRRRGELTIPRYLRGLMRRQVTPYLSLRDPRPSVMVGVHRVRGRLPRRGDRR